jgi:septal ring factor EnvC (AmiA/AmiB activator)
MTPEERFEYIEATLQSVSNRLDILTKIHLDSEQEWRERMDRIEASIEKMSAENRERDRRWSEVVDAIARLALIAQRHEQRLDDLEGKS